MVGKKGMSPIIATVLLIAFAVALGAMIMNWSSNLVATEAHDDACGMAKLTIRQPVCFGDNEIKINVVNSGPEALAGLVLRIVTDDFDQEINIKNSVLDPNTALVRNVPAIKPTGAEVQLVAVIPGEERNVCDTPTYSTTDIPTC